MFSLVLIIKIIELYAENKLPVFINNVLYNWKKDLNMSKYGLEISSKE